MRKQQIAGFGLLLVLLCSLYANATTATVVKIPTVTGISGFGSATQEKQWVSTEGGKTISVHGWHFSQTSAAPSGQDFRVWLKQGANSKPSTEQTHDDAFNSNVKANMVAHKLPGISSVFGASSVNGEFDVLLTDPAGLSIQQSSNIGTKGKIHYDLSRTPIIYDIQPSTVYPGQEQTVTMYSEYSKGSGTRTLNEWRTSGYTHDVGSHEDVNGPRHDKWNRWTASSIVGDMPTKKDNSIVINMATGDSLTTDWAKTTLLGGETYTVRTAASVTSVNLAEGYIAGGAILKISGAGFGEDATNVAITTDGKTCTIISVSNNLITCRIASNTAVSAAGLQAGGLGAIVDQFDGKPVTLDLATETPTIKTVMTDFYNRTNYDTDVASSFTRVARAWFMPEVTADYTFFHQCSSNCEVWFSSTFDNEAAKTKIISLQTGSSNSWRMDTITAKSAPQSLTQGKKYYIEARQEGGDWKRLQVGVIVANSNTHAHSRKEWKKMTVDPVHTYQKYSLSIDDGNDNPFKVVFETPNEYMPRFTGNYDAAPLTSKDIKASQTEDQFRVSIRDFFNRIHYPAGNSLKITKTVTGTVTKFDFELQMPFATQLIKQLTVKSGHTNNGTITHTLWTGTATDKISGKFIVNIMDGSTNVADTEEFGFDWSAEGLARYVIEKYPVLKGKLQIIRDYTTFPHALSGSEFIYHAIGYPNLKLKAKPATVTPLQGGRLGTNGNATNANMPDSTTYVAANNDVVYKSIPAQYLRTYHKDSPQTVVNIRGVPAACPNRNCEFKYIANAGTVNTVSYNAGTQVVTISGTSLPTGADLTGVTIGTYTNSVDTIRDCTLISGGSATQITCKINRPLGGKYVVDVLSKKGAVAHNGSPKKDITINHSITSFSPASVSSTGGDLLTIVGTNFAMDKDEATRLGATVKVGTAVCAIRTWSTTKITCEMPAGATTNKVTITQKTIPIDSTNNLNVATVSETVSSVTPTQISPGFKSTFEVVISALENGATADNYYVELVHSSIRHKCRATALDTGAKKLTITFPGSEMHTYAVHVIYRTQNNGIWTDQKRISGGSVTLDAVFKVTNISPTTVSSTGGTLITVTGQGFDGSDQQNNQGTVTFASINKNFVGTVKSVTNTEMKIFLPAWPGNNGDFTGSFKFNAILKGKMEASCASGCMLNYASTNAPTVTSSSVAWDAATNYYVYTVVGTGFGTNSNANPTTAMIDGYTQGIVSQTDTEIKVNVMKFDDMKDRTITIRTNNGYLPGLTKFDMDAKELSLSTNTGSPGGERVWVQVAGLGMKTTKNLQVYYVSNNQNVDACHKLTFYNSARLECITKPMAYSGQDFKVKYDYFPTSATVQSASIDRACANDCTFTAGANQPTVTTATASANNLDLTLDGTNLSVGDVSKLQVWVGGTKASSITSTTATRVVANFADGIPYGTLKARIGFYDTNNMFLKWSNGVDHGKALSGLNPAALNCAYAGGCEVTLTASPNGILNSAKGGDLKVEVCGKMATFNIAGSSAGSVKAILPRTVTKDAVSNYKVEVPQKINSMVTQVANTAADQANAFDGDDSTQSSCANAVTIPTASRARLTKVKFFLPPMNKKYESHVNKAKFVATGATTTTKEFEYTVTEGWNTYDFSAAPLDDITRLEFSSNATIDCKINEIEYWGHVYPANPTTSTTQECTMNFASGSATHAGANKVTYKGSESAVLTALSPRWGGKGDTLTLTGTGFANQGAGISVSIDGNDCPVVTGQSTTTKIVCTVGVRTNVQVTPDLKIKMTGAKSGYVSTNGLTFGYATKWSGADSWSGEFPPIEGDTVSIPAGKRLLVDVPAVPKLKAVVVEGGLIFQPDANANHHRTFDAHYIFVNKGGFLEVGTEAHPYTSKLTITMHSVKEDTTIPVYGSKGIAVRYGTLDMHGVKPSHTWTDLYQTAAANQDTIVVREAVDWKVGDEIAIASTDFIEDKEVGAEDHAERFFIKTITPDVANKKTTIVLEDNLQWSHYGKAGGVKENFRVGGVDHFVDNMRAEVALLTRNVVFQGEEQTSVAGKFGAHIMLHSVGDDSLTGRIENCEFKFVGQAFQLGRYPIHFHMIGDVHNSYVKNNAVHDTYNRAITIHGVHYLTVDNNVAFETMGHAVFIEDAAETKNKITNNCVFKSKRSWSLLNTDQTPASFWITHPDNQFIGNHAGGSDRYGFWFDTQTSALGPSFNPLVTTNPQRARLGEFNHNVAHSNGRYGLRLFHELIPLTDENGPLNDKWTQAPVKDANGNVINPPIQAIFQNFLGYKNTRNCAISERTGFVTWRNFVCVDNILAGMEMSATEYSPHLFGTNNAHIEGGVVVGRSDNWEQSWQEAATTNGIIGPRHEKFTVTGTHFLNFDKTNWAAFSTCSHCFHPAATDSGIRTYYIKDVKFENTPKRIQYSWPLKAIFHDIDGTLTGYTGGWAVKAFNHLKMIPECKQDSASHSGNSELSSLADAAAFEAKFDGLVCKSNVQVRRVVFYNPASVLVGMEMKVMNLDHPVVKHTANATSNTLPHCKNIGGISKPLAGSSPPSEDPDGAYDRLYQTDGALCDQNNYYEIMYRKPTNPANHWGFPFVTGYNYHIHHRWGASDWDKLNVQESEVPTTTQNDRPTYFHFNRTNPVAQLTQTGLAAGMVQINATNTTNVEYALTQTTSTANNAPWPNHATENFYFNNITRHIYMKIQSNSTKQVSRTTDREYVLTIKRCISNCLDIAGAKNLPTTGTYWSTYDWTKNKLGHKPLENDTVVIAGTEWIILDENTPKMKYLEINGRIEFSKVNGTSIELKSDIVFVRGGELLAGDATTPYPADKTAIITISGRKEDRAVVFNDAVFEAGNNLFGNSGWVKLYGSKLTKHKDQLEATADVGATTITLLTGFAEAKVGQTLAIFPNGRKASEGEYAEITGVAQSGKVLTLKTGLQYRHWGAATVDAAVTGGIDARAEVALLDRNIIIQGAHTHTIFDASAHSQYTWGCNFATVDFYDRVKDSNNNEVLMKRTGWTIIDHVEIKMCSQFDSERAAVRFESVGGMGIDPNSVSPNFLYNVPQFSSVTDCSISRGPGWGVKIDGTSMLTFKNNVIFGFINHGAVIEATTDSTFNDNWIGYFTNRPFSAEKLTDSAAALTVGWKKRPLTNLKVQNNRLAGTDGQSGTAFLFPPYPCGSNDGSISGNTVHSSENGAMAYINEKASGCGEVSDVHAYMIKGDGVIHFQSQSNIHFARIKTLDCGWGITPFVGKKGDYGKMMVNDSIIIGDSPLSYSGDCNNAYGAHIPSSCFGGKTFPVMPSSLPYRKVKSESNYGYYGHFTNVEFRHFPTQIRTCGSGQTAAITIQNEDSDYVQPLRLDNTKFNNVHSDAVAYFWDPPQRWANVKDCGNFPCTAPNNVLVKFSGSTTESGTNKPGLPQGSFQLLGNNSKIGGELASSQCTRKTAWSGYVCQDTNLAHMVIDSLDADTYHRSVQPLELTYEGNTGFKNTLNSYMDHVWDGFYTGQTRLSRFPGVVLTGKTFTTFFTGTPPGGLRYILNLAEPNTWIINTVHYLNGGFWNVYAKTKGASNDVQVHGNAVDQATGITRTIQKAKCGENRWDVKTNKLQFYLTEGCELRVSADNVVKGSVRLDWTTDQFYADGGQTKFVDRLSSVLGIPEYRIKVVGIRPGSVIVDFYITSDPNSNDSDYQKQKEVERVNDYLWSLYKAGKLSLGAPILEFSSVTVTKQGAVKQPEESSFKEKKMHPVVITFLVLSAIVLIIGVIVGLIKMIRSSGQKHVVEVDEEKGIYMKGNQTTEIADSSSVNIKKFNDQMD